MANNNKRYNRNKKSKNFDRNAVEELQQAMEGAQTRQEPFLWKNQQGKPEIVGDVSEIDNEKGYIVTFEYPEEYKAQFPDAEVLSSGRLLVKRSFESVTISPRKARRLRHAVAVLISAFSKYDGNNGVEIMTISEIAEKYEVLSDEVVDAMEKLVQVSFGINDIDMEYLTDDSLIQVSGQLVFNNSGFFQ